MLPTKISYSQLCKRLRDMALPPLHDYFEDLTLSSDEKLFHSVRYNPYHVLHQLLPPAKNPNYSLRERSHNLSIPNDISVVERRNFIYRMLFTDI